MKVRHLDAVCLLLLGSCAFEPVGSNNSVPDVASTSGPATTTTPGGSTSGTPDASATSAATVADGSGDDSTSAPTTDEATTAATSGTDGPGCGDGVQDADEECDDGNANEFDGCTTLCTIPTCEDGRHNGDESDVDCGGTCKTCAFCEACTVGEDCRDTLVCGADNRCVTHYEMNVEWNANCGSASQGATIGSLAAGTYRATASPSAGSLWLPPHNPPTTGYFFLAECTGVTFSQMRTPTDQAYADADTAFANMVNETETFDWGGGDLTCWITDKICGDNDGGVSFSLEYVCDP